MSLMPVLEAAGSKKSSNRVIRTFQEPSDDGKEEGCDDGWREGCDEGLDGLADGCEEG